MRVLCLFSRLFGFWLLPVLDDARGNADRDAPGRHIAAHDRAAPDHRVVANRDRRDELRVRAKEDILAYFCTVLLAVSREVGGNDPSGDVGARADAGVADVAEVMHLHIRAERRVLDLGEVADVRAAA